jgi:hypothetical protein
VNIIPEIFTWCVHLAHKPTRLALDSSRTFSTDENAPFDHHAKHKQRQRAAFNVKMYYEAHLASGIELASGIGSNGGDFVY